MEENGTAKLPEAATGADMVKVASKTPPDGVTPFMMIDEIRLEAALGHKQELKRNFGLWSLTSLGIFVGLHKWNNRRGCIYVGGTTAFQALVFSFVVLSSLSYSGAIFPHVLSGRRNMVPGPFYMGQKLSMVMNILALMYIVITVVFFCFPLVLPATVHSMNYTSVIIVGLMVLTALWWFTRGRHEYQGPQYSFEAAERLSAFQAGKEGRRSFIDVASQSPGLYLDEHVHAGCDTIFFE
ncbi:uncharacterized protein N7459_005435 [Penicillium hispanicum]|uniref:uncharacterized protein n=1 Tax=Penicillium hispanicum TaxID=1080232 RepID=UPI0025407836|nr:uncharacterized protein N7459_005435 [Penicillium hispanicum]KAJ5579450.1 hypothetical protein N7459_005435 [Penicillium hispanicum]